MRTAQTVMLLPLIVVLGACQSGWVSMDGSRVTDAQLQQARQTCQVDEKLAALDQARAANSTEAAKASSNEGRMLQLDNFELESYTTYLEIDECMRREGFARS